MSGTLSCEEVMGYAQEMLTILENEDTDIIHLKRLKETLQEIKELRNQQAEQVKRNILALMVQEEDEVKNIQSRQSVTSEEETVKAEIEAAEENLNRQKEEYKGLKQEVDKCRSEHERLVKEKDKVKADSQTNLPKARFDVNLFKSITDIHWQFDSEPDEIKGYVANNSSVKPFSLNAKTQSKFFIANFLWDMVEEEW